MTMLPDKTQTERQVLIAAQAALGLTKITAINNGHSWWIEHIKTGMQWAVVLCGEDIRFERVK